MICFSGEELGEVLDGAVGKPSVCSFVISVEDVEYGMFLVFGDTEDVK